MTKSKGIAGGKLVTLTEDEYALIVKYLQKEPLGISTKEKKRIVRKAKHFTLGDDKQTGGWPHGPVLYYINSHSKEGSMAKEHYLFVPANKIDDLISNVGSVIVL